MFNVHHPVLFLARDRELAEEAWPGDILGIPNHGNPNIGDALTEGEALKFTGIPSFAPAHLPAVRPVDPLRAPPASRALPQPAQDGAPPLAKSHFGASGPVGRVRPLQVRGLGDPL